jgi:ribosomal protein S16
VRSHNSRFARKGAELLRVLKLVGLERASTDELIGRLLETNAIAASDPDKIANWISAGENLRHQHNPEAREGVFSAVVQNVEPYGETGRALEELGLKYKPRYDSFEGTVDVDAVLSKLAGTSASLRMRVGKEGRKGGDSYILILRDGAEIKDARAILLGRGKAVHAADAGAGEDAGAGNNAETVPLDDKKAGARAHAGRGFGQRAFSGPSAAPPDKDNSAE